MFSNPLTAAMTMQLLCFLGLMVVFVYIVRALSSLGAEMREAFRKQQMFLSDLERQIMDTGFALRRLQGEEPENAAPAGGGDDLLSLLENAARTAPSLPLDGAAQKGIAFAAADDYDPAKDPNLFDDAFGPAATGLSGGLPGRGRR